MHPRTRLKVCCIASIDEARLAISLGADALGLVARMPSGPGPIGDALIADIARSVPPPVATFLLTSRTHPGPIVQHIAAAGVTTVQLVDQVEPGVYGAIRRALPNIRIVQVIHVQSAADVELARSASEGVDALLLDSGRPGAAVRELGGTGRTHDWTVSRKIVESVSVPVFLAGGLHAGNAREAIETVRPYAIDVCSGVRTGGRLDSAKLAALVNIVR